MSSYPVPIQLLIYFCMALAFSLLAITGWQALSRSKPPQFLAGMAVQMLGCLGYLLAVYAGPERLGTAYGYATILSLSASLAGAIVWAKAARKGPRVQ